MSDKSIRPNIQFGSIVSHKIKCQVIKWQIECTQHTFLHLLRLWWLTTGDAGHFVFENAKCLQNKNIQVFYKL